jgi:predicted nucleic acid-binding protein
MNRLVVDTDVVSFLFKDHPIAKLYDFELLGHTLVLSFMTLAELDRWVIQRKWGMHAASGLIATWTPS